MHQLINRTVVLHTDPFLSFFFLIKKTLYGHGLDNKNGPDGKKEYIIPVLMAVVIRLVVIIRTLVQLPTRVLVPHQDRA